MEDLKFRLRRERGLLNTQAEVHSIHNASSNTGAIRKWIDSVSSLHRTAPLSEVVRLSVHVDIEKLMQEWNPELEATLKKVKIMNTRITVGKTSFS